MYTTIISYVTFNSINFYIESSKLTQELGFLPTAADTDHVHPNELQIMVIQARDIIAADTALFASQNTSDPYVGISVVGDPSVKYPTFKTKALSKTIHPVWNQKYVL